MVILSAFAVVVDQLTTARIRSDFNNEMVAAVDKLRDDLLADRQRAQAHGRLRVAEPRPLRRVQQRHHPRPRRGRDHPRPDQEGSQPRLPALPERGARVGGLRVETRQTQLRPASAPGFAFTVSVQYARKVSDVETTIERVRFFLGVGVIGGTLLALLGGVLLGRRAMRPIAR